MGHRLLFQNKIVFLSLNIVFVLANSVDPDKMPHSKAFHLGLHCLWQHTIRGHYTMYKGLSGALTVITVYILIYIL